MKGASVPAQAFSNDRDPFRLNAEAMKYQRALDHHVVTLLLIAHGRPGAFRIGNAWIDAEVLKGHAADLALWGVETIALWCCHIGSDADFPAIYADLFGERTFNNSKGGWGYDYFTSYALPDFIG